ncbi:competence protein CoiA family protein [Streptomyces sp. NPDC006544]|uniref:competence protein CoiA family protein n=1 Tax=Streptomyces sp. NPDC006544 TaxID=3154583 RepID=UPI0033A09B90
MAFRAVHAEWGTVFSHLPDLGCGRAWEAVWKVRPPAAIACPECGHSMYAKTSERGLRFFAHAPHAPDCEIARQGESEAHHLLKLELVSAARQAGAHAELEVRAPDGSWRADVLASDPAGTWRIALEAQLSPITVAEITERTQRMDAHNVSCCWFSDRARPPWLGAVPSVRLVSAEGGLAVAEGLVKFTGRSWEPGPQVPLVEFLHWLFTCRVFPHTPRVRLRYPQRQLTEVWTALQYIRDEEVYLWQEEERQRQAAEERERLQERARYRRADIDRKNAASRRAALERATACEAEARRAHLGPAGAQWYDALMRRPGVGQAVGHLAREHHITVTPGLSTGDPRWGGGTPLIGPDGTPAAVLSPVARLIRGEAFRLLAGMLLLFETSTEQQGFDRNTRRRKAPIGGWRTEHLPSASAGSAGPAAVPAPRRARPRQTGGSCTCTKPELTVVIMGQPHPAEPAERTTPASAVYAASCRTCGGPYDKPWRRCTT